MNHKRKKSRRQVRCTLCTKTHWLGNCRERWPLQYRRETQRGAGRPRCDELLGLIEQALARVELLTEGSSRTVKAGPM